MDELDGDGHVADRVIQGPTPEARRQERAEGTEPLAGAIEEVTRGLPGGLHVR